MKPPAFNQKRYRGRIRNAMRSAYHHLFILLNYENKYLANPPTQYPQHLAPDAEWAKAAAAIVQLQTWLADKGPIP